jgi:hypothetical protein
MHKRVEQSRTSLWTYNIMFQPSDCLVPSPLPGQGRGPGTHLFAHPQNYPIVDTHFMYCADSLIPRPSRVPARKRIWYFSRLFLAFAEASRRKTHVPIRLLDFKISRDCKVRQLLVRCWIQFTVYTSIVRTGME